jgi:hypothetical protein
VKPEGIPLLIAGLLSVAAASGWLEVELIEDGKTRRGAMPFQIK